MGKQFKDELNIKSDEVLAALGIQKSQISDLDAIRTGLKKLSEDNQNLLEAYGQGIETDNPSVLHGLLNDLQKVSKKETPDFANATRNGADPAYLISSRLQLTAISQKKPLNEGQEINLSYKSDGLCTDLTFKIQLNARGQFEMADRKEVSAIIGAHDSRAVTAPVLHPQSHQCRP